MPTSEDVRTASDQARSAVVGAFEQVRTPVMAAIGAGDIATQAVVDVVRRARTQVNERAESARAAVEDFPSDMSHLRERLDPGELRKLFDQYAEAAVKLYQHLAEQGEKTVERLRAQPRYQRAVERFDQAVETAQHRAEVAVDDARELADDVLGKVAGRTRAAGEEAARATEELADKTAEAAHETGEEVAHELRSTSRKAASKASGPRKSTAPRGSGTHKPEHN